MPFDDVLICANGPGLIESRLELASQLTNRFECHVRAVFFRSALDPLSTNADAIPFNDVSAQQDTLTRAWNDEAVEIQKAKNAYIRWSTLRGLSTASAPDDPQMGKVSWTEIVGKPVDQLPSYARACDLIIAGGPGENSSESTLDDEISRIALLTSGRTTLFAPRAGNASEDVLRSVLIAWDDGHAVSRTIAQAMPLILAAQSVTLFICETSPQHAIPCNAMLAYLRRKGVKPTIVTAEPAVRTVRQTLVQKALELGVSLIVMGAYEHSRAREILLGGTTQYVIQHAHCPVLMTS